MPTLTFANATPSYMKILRNDYEPATGNEEAPTASGTCRIADICNAKLLV